MSEIPREIVEQAIDLHLSAREANGTALGLTDYTQLIARAIMAERERCAKIIEDNMLVDWPAGSESIIPRSNSGNKVGLAYATAIRSHPQQGDVK